MTAIETESAAMLDIRGVAKMLGVSGRHVWTLASTGRLPRPVKLGKCARWKREALEQWLAAEHERANGGGR